MIETSRLDSLGLSFGTDKSSWQHDFLRFYEPYFEPIRHKSIKFLEIGVAGGASLRVWEDYFPNASIIGADINPEAKKFARDRVVIEIVDQSDVESLVRLAEKHGPFDIIIEDGSHMWDHQIISLKALFPHVVDGGFYIVEDLQTNFGRLGPAFRGKSDISCVEYLKRLLDVRVADATLDLNDLDDPFLSYGRQMRTINFYREACLIQRDQALNVEPSLISSPKGEELEELTLLAHIGGYGDRKSETQFIRGRGALQNIQGFSVHTSTPLRDHLDYRALRQDGSWTDWVKCGEFVGSRGKSEDLQGLSFRLSSEGQRRYEIKVIGAFRGHTDPIVSGNAQPCASPTGSSPLWAFEIQVRNNGASL